LLECRLSRGVGRNRREGPRLSPSNDESAKREVTYFFPHLQSFRGNTDMNNEPKRIADQLHRAYTGAAWHGPALSQLLRGVSAKQAAARPIRGAHSIWELVLHITAWTEVIRRRALGEAIELKMRQNFPPVGDSSPAAWRTTLQSLAAAHHRLERTVARLPE